MSTTLFDTIEKLTSPDEIYHRGRELIVDRAFEGVGLKKQTITEKNSQLSDVKELNGIHTIDTNVISVLAQEIGQMGIFEGSGALVVLNRFQTPPSMKDTDQSTNLERARIEIASLVKFDAMISEFMTKESINIHGIASKYLEKMNSVV